MLLMDHQEDCEKSQDLFDAVEFLTQTCGLNCKAEEIGGILGIIRTNALKIQGTSSKVVYPTMSYASHSCLANAKYSMSPGKEKKIRLRHAVLA